MLPSAVLAPSVAAVPLKAVSAESPTATLHSVVVFSLSASAPIAVLNSPLCSLHRNGTNGGIVRSFRVIPDRCSANSAVTEAGVHKERSKTNGHVEVADVVVGERFRPNGHVLWPVVLL